MSKNIRTIVIDNEEGGMELIIREIADYNRYNGNIVDIVGKAMDSSTAIKMVESLQPQLIISDIKLSDDNDTIFKVLNKLQERGEVGLPYAILVSGYAEKYYEEAFNHQSPLPIITVLHKASLTADKLVIPIKKVLFNLSNYETAVNKRQFTYGDHVYLRFRGGGDKNNGDWFVAVECIKCIYSEGANVKVIFEHNKRKTRLARTGDGKAHEIEYYEMDDSVGYLGMGLGKAAQRLDPKYFVQINPGTVINIKYIEEIKLDVGRLEMKIYGIKEWLYLTGDDRISNFKSYFQFTP